MSGFQGVPAQKLSGLGVLVYVIIAQNIRDSFRLGRFPGFFGGLNT